MTYLAPFEECGAELISPDSVTYVCGQIIGHLGPHVCHELRWTGGRLPPQAVTDGWTTKQ